MKINVNDLRVGNVIELDGKLLQIIKKETTKPGKGGAYLQADVRDLNTGNKDNLRLSTKESVTRAYLEKKKHQFLFSDGEMFTFMDGDSYEQVEIKQDLIGEPAQFLKDGMNVDIEFHEGTPLSIELPENVTFEIAEADPVVKGQTASSSYKPAVLENGVRVMVPPHIDAGTRVVIKSTDGSYVEKAKD